MKQNDYEEGLDGYDWYEGQPKWPLRRILKVTAYSISAVVWILILARIFSSSNSLFEKDLILLNEANSEIYPAQTTEVIRINSAVEESADLSVLMKNPVYLDRVNNVQFTVRINRRHLTPKEGAGPGFCFVLRETRGNESQFYQLSYYAKEQSSNYDFYRLCFDGVALKDGATYTFMIFSADFQSEDPESPYPGSKAKFVFHLCDGSTYLDRASFDKDAFRRVEEFQ